MITQPSQSYRLCVERVSGVRERTCSLFLYLSPRIDWELNPSQTEDSAQTTVLAYRRRFR